MFKIAAVVAGILLASLQGAFAANEPPQDDLSYFLDNSYGRYVSENREPTLEDILYTVAKDADNWDAAIAIFAQRTGDSEETARHNADTILAAVRFREACSRERAPSACAFTPGTPLFDLLKIFGFADKSGALAISVGENITGFDDVRTAFIAEMTRHPARGVIFDALYDYTHEFHYLLPILAAGEINIQHATSLFSTSSSMFERCDPKCPELLAVIEVAWRRTGMKPGFDAQHRLLTALYVDGLARTGQTKDAYAHYQLLFADGRKNLFVPPEGVESDKSMRASYRRLALDLSACAFVRGKRRSARELLATWTKLADSAPDGEVRLSERQQAAFLREDMRPTLKTGDVYDMFLNGYLPGAPVPKRDEDEYRYPDSVSGWLSAISNGSPALEGLGAAYVRKRGYREMAAFLLSQEIAKDGYHVKDLPETMVEALGLSFVAARAKFSSKIARVRLGRASERALGGHEPAKAPIATVQPAAYFTELPLPEAMRTPPPCAQERSTATSKDESARCRSGRSEDPAIPEDVPLPVNAFQVIRYAEENGSRAIVYVSSELDPTGEVPAPGYWFQRTRVGSDVWEPPVYLGLQQYFPYIIRGTSKLPMLTDDALQLEVSIQEIDRKSISFPPVGLRWKSEAHDLYLRFPWKDLLADEDGDGMTSVMERRVGLDPKNPDTDGDGKLDGADSLPLTAFNPDAPAADREVAYAILEQMVGFDRGAIVERVRNADDDLGSYLENLPARRPNSEPAMRTIILAADPDLFAGLQLPMRVLVYDSESAKKISESRVFYPPGIQWMFSRLDGSERRIIWSAGWVGGEFSVSKSGDGYVTEILSSWIS